MLTLLYSDVGFLEKQLRWQYKKNVERWKMPKSLFAISLQTQICIRGAQWRSG